MPATIYISLRSIKKLLRALRPLGAFAPAERLIRLSASLPFIKLPLEREFYVVRRFGSMGV